MPIRNPKDSMQRQNTETAMTGALPLGAFGQLEGTGFDGIEKVGGLLGQADTKWDRFRVRE